MPGGIQANVMQTSVQRAPVGPLRASGLGLLGKVHLDSDWCKRGETADTSRVAMQIQRDRTPGVFSTEPGASKFWSSHRQYPRQYPLQPAHLVDAETEAQGRCIPWGEGGGGKRL